MFGVKYMKMQFICLCFISIYSRCFGTFTLISLWDKLVCQYGCSGTSSMQCAELQYPYNIHYSQQFLLDIFAPRLRVFVSVHVMILGMSSHRFVYGLKTMM